MIIHNEFVGGDLNGKPLFPPLSNWERTSGLAGEDHTYLRRHIGPGLDAFVDSEIDENQARTMVLGKRNKTKSAHVME
jgi:hypothetical protein